VDLKRLKLSEFKQGATEQQGDDAPRVLIPKVCATEIKQEGADDERTLTFTISTGAVDRDGDTIDPHGWELGDFVKAGVVLFGHDSWNPPIAEPLATWVEQGKLKSRAKFPTAETYEFGNLIFRLVKERLLKATSVGFIPLEWSINEERPSTGWGPAIDFLRQTLLEWSVVPVPANPEALVGAAMKGFDLAPLYEWTEKALDGEHGPKLIVPRDPIEAAHKILQPTWGTKAKASQQLPVGKEIKGVIAYGRAHPDGTPKSPEDEAWDGGGEVAEAEVDDLQVMTAWVDSEDASNKRAYKLPHHKAEGEHSLVWNGLTAAMGALLGARGGVDIPEEDRQGVYNHLSRHYEEFDKEPPEFRAAGEDDDDEDHPDEEDDKTMDAIEVIDKAFDEMVEAEAEVLNLVIASLASIAKRGRVLSAANEQRLREAQKLLSEVLDQIDQQDDQVDDDDDGKGAGGVVIDKQVLAFAVKAVKEAVARKVKLASGELA
jgi:hypothetical protein